MDHKNALSVPLHPVPKVNKRINQITDVRTFNLSSIHSFLSESKGEQISRGRHARSTRDANRQKGDPARAQPDNQTKRQPDRRGVPGRQRRTGAEKAAPITLE